MKRSIRYLTLPLALLAGTPALAANLQSSTTAPRVADLPKAQELARVNQAAARVGAIATSLDE